MAAETIFFIQDSNTAIEIEKNKKIHEKQVNNLSRSTFHQP